MLSLKNGKNAEAALGEGPLLAAKESLPHNQNPGYGHAFHRLYKIAIDLI